MTAPHLVLRSWLASRQAVPALASGLLISVLAATFPSVAGLQFGHWNGSPPLTIAYENVFAATAAIVSTALVLSARPEWERSARPPKLRLAQTLTWMLAAVAATSVGPVICSLRISYEPHPWSLLTTHLLVSGIAGCAIGLLGATRGALITVGLLIAAVVTEQTTGIRWLLSDPFHTPATTTAVFAILLAALTQWTTTGVPLRLKTSAS